MDFDRNVQDCNDSDFLHQKWNSPSEGHKKSTPSSDSEGAF